MILLDSSFLVAYHNLRDTHHAKADAAMQRLLDEEWGQALLLEYVFLEVVTVLLSRRGPAVAVEVSDILLHARELEFIPCSAYFDAALAIFRSQKRSRLSFTDAAIVAVARKREVPWIATFDRDFKGLQGITLIPGSD